MSLVGVDLAICAFCLCFVRRCDHVEVTVTSYSPPPLVSLRVLFIQTNVPFSPLSIESNREGEHFTTLPFSSPSAVARRQGQSGPVRTFSIDLRPELAAYQAALFSGLITRRELNAGLSSPIRPSSRPSPARSITAKVVLRSLTIKQYAGLRLPFTTTRTCPAGSSWSRLGSPSPSENQGSGTTDR